MIGNKKLRYFGIILLAVVVSFIIHSFIMSNIASNAIIISGFICLIFIIPSLIFGFIIFLFLSRSRFERFINIKSVSVVAIFVSLLIIIPTIFFYYDTVPPEEVTNWWICDPDQEICNETSGMMIIYDLTYAWKDGSFTTVNPDLPRSDFHWKYDESSKIITFSGQRESWELKLRLDIDTSKEPLYTMTTYYVSDQNFPFFNVTLFDGANWTGAW